VAPSEPAQQPPASGKSSGNAEPTAPSAGAEASREAAGATPPAAEAPANPPTGTQTAAATPDAGAAEAREAATTHVIAAGDTLWDLAQEFYGDPMQWRKLAEANPQLRPRRLVIGATLNVPSAE